MQLNAVGLRNKEKVGWSKYTFEEKFVNMRFSKIFKALILKPILPFFKLKLIWPDRDPTENEDCLWAEAELKFVNRTRAMYTR